MAEEKIGTQDAATDNMSQKLGAPDRRGLLKLGAVGAAGAFTMRAGSAWAVSIACTVSLPALNADGSVNDGNSTPAAGAVVLDREQIQDLFESEPLLDSNNPSDVDDIARLEYLRNLTNGAGLSCVNSALGI